MTGLLDRFRRAAERRARYTRTLTELRRMPLDVQLDLDLYSGDFPRLSRDAAQG